MFGTYKAIAPSAATLAGSFRTVIRCNNLETINANTAGITIDPAAIKQMKRFAARKGRV